MTSGDGWVHCLQGHRHWGRYGAAGLLLAREEEVLLHLRSFASHHGGTWSIPGGARNRGEGAVDAAVREAREEIGLSFSRLQVFAELVADHGHWSYTTVLAQAEGMLHQGHNYETDAVAWVSVAAVEDLPLHPGFRESWAAIRVRLETLSEFRSDD